MTAKITTLTLGCLLTASAVAAEGMLAEIDGLEPGATVVRGFVLERPQEVRIAAKGLRLQWAEDKKIDFAAAWILDADSREVVWTMADDNFVEGERGLRQHRDELRLDAGTYEAYYATYPVEHGYQKHESWWQGVGRALGKMFGWGDEVAYDQSVAELGITVRGAGRALSSEELGQLRQDLRQDALVAVSAIGGQFRGKRGFVLERPVELEVYAVGELTRDGGWDYGWILDAATRERVWTFTFDASEPAGGGEKNRAVRDTLRLPAGEYAAVFVTDGSHSPGDWNTLPPYDPDAWGMTLRVREPEQRRYAKAFDYRELPGDDRIVAEVTRLRGGESRSRGFSLSAPATLRVYAVGEGFAGHGMADHGWIVDARTHEKVWSMSYEHTEHAGGDRKNRVADDIVHLEPGCYLLVAVTDNSHTYRDWNGDPPTYPERWGITLYGAGEDFDPSVVSVYRVDEDPAILARIAEVRSGSEKRQEFALDRDARVWIYAVGEGMEGEMYDYGWLEDASGQVVWQMAFADTGGAGGDAKNRLYRGALDLSAGEYSLRYRTDDSHAYREWNSAPPTDPEAWGIQVTLVENGS